MKKGSDIHTYIHTYTHTVTHTHTRDNVSIIILYKKNNLRKHKKVGEKCLPGPFIVYVDEYMIHLKRKN